MRVNRIGKLALAAAIFGQSFVGSWAAAEEEEVQSTSNHVEIGSAGDDYRDRGIDPSDFENRKEIEATEEPTNGSSDEAVAEGEKEVEFGAVYLVDDVTYQAAHTVYGVSASGGTVKINDGSHWTVSLGDRYKTRYWEYRDLIVIATNDAIFPQTRFKMINYTLGESAQVEIYLGPQIDLDYRWIYAIDYITMVVWLDDGTCWDISGSMSQFDRWSPEHFVIVGVNKGWGSSVYPFILYNVSRDDYMIADSI